MGTKPRLQGSASASPLSVELAIRMPIAHRIKERNEDAVPVKKRLFLVLLYRVELLLDSPCDHPSRHVPGSLRLIRGDPAQLA